MNFPMTPSCGLVLLISFNAAVPVAGKSSAYLHRYGKMLQP